MSEIAHVITTERVIPAGYFRYDQVLTDKQVAALRSLVESGADLYDLAALLGGEYIEAA